MSWMQIVITAAALAGATPDVPLYPGLGSHHHPITTGSPEAQKYFDQGLRLVFAFNHDEAERAFRQAARLDPVCAMAWWGIAITLGPNINLPIDPERNRAAVEAVQKARTLAGRATEVERAYIEAVADRYSSDPAADRGTLDRAYAAAMRELAGHYPEDLDAATLYAESLMDLHPWQLWSPDGTPAEGTAEIVSVLESVLRRDPMHPGANHYYVHAVEASPHPERALASAGRLETLVPDAGHLVHMPAHIYMRTGDYAGAARSNKVAAEADERFIARSGAQGIYPLMYYSHNLHFLAAAHMMEGNHAEAKSAAGQLLANVGSAAREMQMAEFFVPTPLFVALRFQRWDEILAGAEPAGGQVTTRALWHYARGVALAMKGDVAGARGEREKFATLRGEVPADHVFGVNLCSIILDVAAPVLDARIAWAAGDRAGSIKAWEQAVAAEDAVAYDEPPGWYYPVRESLGAALLMASRLDEAAKIFRADLERHPRNGRALFGLWKTLEAQKKEADAAWVSAEFEAAWRNADVALRIEEF